MTELRYIITQTYYPGGGYFSLQLNDRHSLHVGDFIVLRECGAADGEYRIATANQDAGTVWVEHKPGITHDFSGGTLACLQYIITQTYYPGDGYVSMQLDDRHDLRDGSPITLRNCGAADGEYRTVMANPSAGIVWVEHKPGVTHDFSGGTLTPAALVAIVPQPQPPQLPPQPQPLPPASWTINPLIHGVAYGPTGTSPDGSFVFPICPAQPQRTDGMHTLVRPSAPLNYGDTLFCDFEIDGDSEFVGAQEQASPARCSLFLQRAGDNWTGAGVYNEYRAYSRDVAPPYGQALRKGRFQLSVPLVFEKWTNVQTEGTERGFRELLANIERIDDFNRVLLSEVANTLWTKQSSEDG